MQSIWQMHAIICLCLASAAIPVYFLDKAAVGGGGGNWIALDFRGLIFWTYVVLLAIDAVVSSIAILLFPNSDIFRIHVASIVASIILLVAAFIVYAQVLRAQSISTTVGKRCQEIGASAAFNPGKTKVKLHRDAFCRSFRIRDWSFGP